MVNLISHSTLDRLAASKHGGGAFRRIIARTKSRKLILLVTLSLTILLFLFFSHLKDPVSQWSLKRLPFGWKVNHEPQCLPEEYASGEWIHRPYYQREGPLTKTYHKNDTEFVVDTNRLQKMAKPEDILEFARYEACASSREYFWHLGADNAEQYDRFPGALEWEWAPGGHCQDPKSGLRDWSREEVVRDLVEGGGWLLVGDSVTENHFFSLSCLLYPHVIGWPNYRLLHSWDRAMPQHLYLNPDSPLLETLNLPDKFNISSTPLVSFRRVDLLWSKEDLEKFHKETHPEYYQHADFKLFGEEPAWSISPQEYFEIFSTPLPLGNYATMVVSTAGHWTTGTFYGYAVGQYLPYDPDQPTKPVWEYDGLLQFYGEVMARWVVDMQALVQGSKVERSLDNPRRRDQKVLVRAYLPGHEDCHKTRSAWKDIQPFQFNWWNWPIIWKFNDVFKDLLSDRVQYPDVVYLPIDRPARLRPDAHSSGDCLHIMSGAGVLEGWSHYIWHFITREI